MQSARISLQLDSRTRCEIGSQAISQVNSGHTDLEWIKASDVNYGNRSSKTSCVSWEGGGTCVMSMKRRYQSATSNFSSNVTARHPFPSPPDYESHLSSFVVASATEHVRSSRGARICCFIHTNLINIIDGFGSRTSLSDDGRKSIEKFSHDVTRAVGRENFGCSRN